MKATVETQAPTTLNKVRVHSFRKELPEAVDWDAVHAAIQKVLLPIANSLPPGINAKGDCTKLPRFFSSYLTCKNEAHPDIDPVIVGVEFCRPGEKIMVWGDISGECIGDMLFEAGPEMEAEGHTAALADAGSAIAQILAQQAHLAVTALHDSSRLPKD